MSSKQIKIARVFPRKTNMSPVDPNTYFDVPDLFTPHYDEVHISVTFTWDLKRADELADVWVSKTDKLIRGGPAYDDRGEWFIPGMYLKLGVTITSRGCPNNCPWCYVPLREGKIRELPVFSGNIIQDNNLLACSKDHINKVFKMLRKEKHINFSGGLEVARITDWVAEELSKLKIYQLWLAYDHPNQEKLLKEAVEKLRRRYFKRDQIRCYVLIGYEGDTLEKAEDRLRRAWEIGTLPFAMRYRTPSPNRNETYLFKERAWNLFTREWTRPAIIKTKMKEQYAEIRTETSPALL